MRRGLKVSVSDTFDAYDFLVIYANGTHARVQVKSNFVTSGKDRVRFRIKRTRKQNYSIKDVDFFALYIDAISSWYIIPVSFFQEQISLFPQDQNCKWRPFLSAWSLLEK